jgi:hypothetical protein
LKKVLAIDPEDVPAHYTLMVADRGLGDTAKADRKEKLFRRFKADESAQAITPKRRQQSARRRQRAPDDPRTRVHSFTPMLRRVLPVTCIATMLLSAQPSPVRFLEVTKAAGLQLRARRRRSGQTLAP